MDSGDKKRKHRPYSEYERQLLKQLVQSKIDVVRNRKTDGTTQKKKCEAWEDIARQFNNSYNVYQTASAAQLKKMWHNLKAKDAKTLVMDAQRKCGSGPALPDTGKEETQVLSIIPTVMPSINVEIDSDNGKPSTSELSPDDDDSVYWQSKRSRIMDFEVHVVEEEGENTESLQGSSYNINNPNKFLTSPSKESKRRLTNPRDSKSLEDLKKELMKKEIDKINQQIKQEEEKHRIELQILELRRDILIKEFNNK